MATVVQASLANTAFPLFLAGEPRIAPAEVILTDAARTFPLVQYTVMSQIAGSLKWYPWITGNLGSTTGLQYPMGIYLGDAITAALENAGDITNCPILIGGAGLMVDANLLVFDTGPTHALAALTLSSVMTVPTNLAMIAERWLNLLGIFPTGTLQGDLTEH